MPKEAALDRASVVNESKTETDQVAEGSQSARPPVLLIEDSPDYSARVSEMIELGWQEPPPVARRGSLASGLELLTEREPMCVLLDLSLPDAAGLEGVRELLSTGTSAPIVLLAGGEDTDLALRAVQAGAQDYILKDEVSEELLKSRIDFAVERKRAEARLIDEVAHDPLTGLRGRSLLIDRLEQTLIDRPPTDASLAVVCADLDRFKAINDSLGHAAGDRLLIEVARRLQDVLRETDTLARFGGDEFMILLPTVRSTEEVKQIAYRLVRAVSEKSCWIDGHEIFVQISVGIALAEGGDELERLDSIIGRADTAMYKAKRTKRSIAFAEPEDTAAAVARLQVEERLRSAHEQRDIGLHYQAQVAVAEDGLFGVEALARWHDAKLGEVSPATFIPLAEEVGMMVPLGRRLLHEACRQAAVWLPKSPHLMMSANISIHELTDEGFVHFVESALRRHGLPAQHLCLEVNEQNLNEDFSLPRERLAQLRQMGCWIAIDNFGAGDVSLSKLGQLPADYLKIDRALVNGLDSNPEVRRLATTAVAMANALGMRPVAQGVETEAEAEVMRELGCELMQGWLYGGAEPPSADPAELLEKAAGWH